MIVANGEMGPTYIYIYIRWLVLEGHARFQLLETYKTIGMHAMWNQWRGTGTGHTIPCDCYLTLMSTATNPFPAYPFCINHKLTSSNKWNLISFWAELWNQRTSIILYETQIYTSTTKRDIFIPNLIILYIYINSF